MKVWSKQDTWDLANRLFPTDYEKDEKSSKNAGYPIYRSTAEGYENDWISDLGNRLELNYHTGKSENIWVEELQPKRTPTVILGKYQLRRVFGDVHVKEVGETRIEGCVGMVMRKSQNSSDVTYEFTIPGCKKEVVPAETLAYIRFEQK